MNAALMEYGPTLTDDRAVTVDVGHLWCLQRLLGGIPGGLGAPFCSAGDVPDLGALVECLDRDLERCREIMAELEIDRAAFHSLRQDVGAMRRLVGNDR